jgi:hypothetical protein
LEKNGKNGKKALASSSSSSSNYIQPKTAVRQYGISHTTLVKWARDGKIRSIRTGDGLTSGHRYNEEDLKVHLKVPLASQETEGRRRLIFQMTSALGPVNTTSASPMLTESTAKTR